MLWRNHCLFTPLLKEIPIEANYWIVQVALYEKITQALNFMPHCDIVRQKGKAIWFMVLAMEVITAFPKINISCLRLFHFIFSFFFFPRILSSTSYCFIQQITCVLTLPSQDNDAKIQGSRMLQARPLNQVETSQLQLLD